LSFRQKKILLVIPALTIGGAEKAIVEIANELHQFHKVEMIIFENKIQLPIGEYQITSLNCPASGSIVTKIFNVVLRVFKLFFIFLRRRPDQIISFTESANYPTIIAALFAGCARKLDVSVRTNPKYIDQKHKPFISVLYRFPRRVVMNSQGAVAELLKQFSLMPAKVKVIHNAVDLNKVLKLSEESLNLFPPFFVCVGRLAPEKRFDHVLAAFCQSGLSPHCKLIFVGDGPEREKLEEEADRLGISKSVQFVGFTKNPYPYMKHALALVITSKFEGWPNVISEAMATGCPVLSYRFNFGPSELIVNDRNGFIFSDGQVSEMSSGMKNVYEFSDEKRKIFSQACKESVQKFSVSRIIGEWVIP